MAFAGKWIVLVGPDTVLGTGPLSRRVRSGITRLATEVVGAGPAGLVSALTGWTDQVAVVAFRTANARLPIVGVRPREAHAIPSAVTTTMSICTETLVVPAKPDSCFTRPTVDGAVMSMARTKAQGSPGVVVLALRGEDGIREERMKVLAGIWGVEYVERPLATLET